MKVDPSRCVVLLCLLAAFLAPCRSAAQERPGEARGGLWWEVSAAAGGARLTCPLCDPARELGPAIDVAVGAYASPGLRVGVDGGGWTGKDGDTRETVYRTGLVAQVHPSAERGLHLLVGLGWSGYRSEEFAYDAVRLSLGAGWDLPLTEGWVAGNRVILDGSSWASLKNEETSVARSVGLSLVRFGVFLRRR